MIVHGDEWYYRNNSTIKETIKVIGGLLKVQAGSIKMTCMLVNVQDSLEIENN